MDSAIRLYLDENMHVAIAVQLRKKGYDVVTVQELGLRGASDFQHLERARELGRVICTLDQDFLRLRDENHAGIVFGSSHASIGDWVAFLDLLCQSLSMEEMQNHIEYV